MMQEMKLLTFAKKPFMRFQVDDLRDRCHGSESQLKSLKSSVSALLLIIEACVKVLLIFFFHLSPFFCLHPLSQRFTYNPSVIATLFNDLLSCCSSSFWLYCHRCISGNLRAKTPPEIIQDRCSTCFKILNGSSQGFVTDTVSS